MNYTHLFLLHKTRDMAVTLNRPFWQAGFVAAALLESHHLEKQRFVCKKVTYQVYLRTVSNGNLRFKGIFVWRYLSL